MLNYFITITEGLTITAILIGLLYAHIPSILGSRGKRMLTIGAVLGLAAAAVMAVLKNTTKLVDSSGGTGMWNVRTFAVSTFALVVYYVFSIKGRRRKLGIKGDAVAAISACVLTFTSVFYALPDVLAYPFNFSLSGESVFSTAFFYRLIGYLLGIILTLLIAAAVCQASKRMKTGAAAILLNIVLFINGFQQITKAAQVLYAKRVISGHALFVLIKYTSNYSDAFIYAAIAVALIAPVVLWIQSFYVKEPYENPAEHRKIRAKWRNSRRWSTLLVFCFVMVVLTLTAFTALDNQVVELSPAEEFDLRGDDIYIPLTQVEDGHLHRFAYTTESSIEVRFIVIKKPNSSAYGIGLDACDICGETGYYERNGQIVCKLCDVVMNINTIGFKGGCNPIVIDYSIENGYIIFPTYTLVEHENEFK